MYTYLTNMIFALWLCPHCWLGFVQLWDQLMPNTAGHAHQNSHFTEGTINHAHTAYVNRGDMVDGYVPIICPNWIRDRIWLHCGADNRIQSIERWHGNDSIILHAIRAINWCEYVPADVDDFLFWRRSAAPTGDWFIQPNPPILITHSSIA